jgi:hypothetical protein
VPKDPQMDDAWKGGKTGGSYACTFDGQLMFVYFSLSFASIASWSRVVSTIYILVLLEKTAASRAAASEYGGPFAEAMEHEYRQTSNVANGILQCR